MSLINVTNDIVEKYNISKSVSFMSFMDNEVEITSPNLFLTVTDTGDSNLNVKRVATDEYTNIDAIADTVVELIQDIYSGEFTDLTSLYIGNNGTVFNPDTSAT